MTKAAIRYVPMSWRLGWPAELVLNVSCCPAAAAAAPFPALILTPALIRLPARHPSRWPHVAVPASGALPWCSSWLAFLCWLRWSVPRR